MKNYSVIIPHKNSPELLNRCLESIPQREDIEIIVVDDFSDTLRRPKVDRKDVEVIHINKIDSKSAGHARNVGLKKATGKWLLFADCDDYYINNAFEEFDKISHSEYDIIFFDYANNIGKATGFQTRLNDILKGGKHAKANFKHMSNAPWNKMFKRQFIEDNKILFEEIPIQNDAFFVHKASSLTNNFHYINKQLYFYEINNNGITRKKRSSKDFERSTTTRIKIDKLRAQSGAWDCITFLYGKQIYVYGYTFVIKQQLRRIKHGLIYFLIRKYIQRIFNY